MGKEMGISIGISAGTMTASRPSAERSSSSMGSRFVPISARGLEGMVRNAPAGFTPPVVSLDQMVRNITHSPIPQTLKNVGLDIPAPRPPVMPLATETVAQTLRHVGLDIPVPTQKTEEKSITSDRRFGGAKVSLVKHAPRVSLMKESPRTDPALVSLRKEGDLAKSKVSLIKEASRPNTARKVTLFERKGGHPVQPSISLRTPMAHALVEQQAKRVTLLKPDVKPEPIIPKIKPEERVAVDVALPVDVSLPKVKTVEQNPIAQRVVEGYIDVLGINREEAERKVERIQQQQEKSEQNVPVTLAESDAISERKVVSAYVSLGLAPTMSAAKLRLRDVLHGKKSPVPESTGVDTKLAQTDQDMQVERPAEKRNQGEKSKVKSVTQEKPVRDTAADKEREMALVGIGTEEIVLFGETAGEHLAQALPSPNQTSAQKSELVKGEAFGSKHSEQKDHSLPELAQEVERLGIITSRFALVARVRSLIKKIPAVKIAQNGEHVTVQDVLRVLGKRKINPHQLG